MRNTVVLLMLGLLLAGGKSILAEPGPPVTWERITPELAGAYDTDLADDGSILVLRREDLQIYHPGPDGPEIETIKLPYQFMNNEFARAATFDQSVQPLLVSQYEESEDTTVVRWWFRTEMGWNPVTLPTSGPVRVVDVDRRDNWYWLLVDVHEMEPSAEVRLLKVAFNGTIQNNYLIDNGPTSVGVDMIPHRAGGLVISGGLWSDGPQGRWVAQFSGNQVNWLRIQDPDWPAFSYWNAREACLASVIDGSILLAGGTSTTGAEHNGVGMVRLDPFGNPLDAWTFPQVGDFGFLIVGGACYTEVGNIPGMTIPFSIQEPPGSMADITLLNISMFGDVLFERTIGGSNYYDSETASTVAWTEEQGLFVSATQATLTPFLESHINTYSAFLDLDNEAPLRARAIPDDAYQQPPYDPPSFTQDGGTLSYTVELFNGDTPDHRDVWIQVADRDPEFSVELHSWSNVLLPAGTTEFEMTQTVPANLPPGAYDYTVLIGDYPWVVEEDAQLTLEILGDNVGQAFREDGWAISGDLEQTSSANEFLPERWSLAPVYPNPFNPSTTVAVTLPETGELTVEVFDVNGARVTTLARGTHASGRYAFTFSGSGLSSGVYFVRAHVPGKLDQVRKAVLLK